MKPGMIVWLIKDLFEFKAGDIFIIRHITTLAGGEYVTLVREVEDRRPQTVPIAYLDFRGNRNRFWCVVARCGNRVLAPGRCCNACGGRYE